MTKLNLQPLVQILAFLIGIQELVAQIRLELWTQASNLLVSPVEHGSVARIVS